MTTTENPTLAVGLRITSQEMMQSLPVGTRIYWHSPSGRNHTRVIDERSGIKWGDIHEAPADSSAVAVELRQLLCDGSFEIIHLPEQVLSPGTRVRVVDYTPAFNGEGCIGECTEPREVCVRFNRRTPYDHGHFESRYVQPIEEVVQVVEPAPPTVLPVVEPEGGWRIPTCSSVEQVLDLLGASVIAQAVYSSRDVDICVGALRELGWEPRQERYNGKPHITYRDYGHPHVYEGGTFVQGNLEYHEDSMARHIRGVENTLLLGSPHQQDLVWLLRTEEECQDTPATETQIREFKTRAADLAYATKNATSWCDDVWRAMSRAGITPGHCTDEESGPLLTPDSVAGLPEGTRLHWDGGVEVEVFIRDDTAANPGRVRCITGPYDYAPLMSVANRPVSVNEMGKLPPGQCLEWSGTVYGRCQDGRWAYPATAPMESRASGESLTYTLNHLAWATNVVYR